MKALLSIFHYLLITSEGGRLDESDAKTHIMLASQARLSTCCGHRKSKSWIDINKIGKFIQQTETLKEHL